MQSLSPAITSERRVRALIAAIIGEARRRARRRRILLAALVCVAISAVIAITFFNPGGGTGGVGTSESDDLAAAQQDSQFVVAMSLRGRAKSKADWIASNPKTTTTQIEWVCEIPREQARGFNQQLGPIFTHETLTELRTACRG